MALARPARASGPPLLLGVSECAELDEREVRRLVVLELGAIPVEQRSPGVTLVTVRCGGLSVQIRVDDPLSRKTVHRSFDTGPLDKRARARWIALAASELVLSSWLELESNPTPEVPAAGPQAPAPVRRAAQAAVRRKTTGIRTWRTLDDGPVQTLEVAKEPVPLLDFPERTPSHTGTVRYDARAVALASFRSFWNGDGDLWGGGLRVSHERFRLLSWSADFLFEAGSVRAAGTKFAIRSGTLGGWLAGYHSSGIFTGRLGVGLRLGIIGTASLGREVGVAAPDDAPEKSSASGVAPWGWPMATSSFTFAGGPVVFEIGMEGGYVVLPVGSASGLSVEGSWFSLQVGLGARRKSPD